MGPEGYAGPENNQESYFAGEFGGLGGRREKVCMCPKFLCGGVCVRMWEVHGARETFAACNCEGRSGEEGEGKVSFYGKTAVIVKTNPDKMLLRKH